MDSGSYLKAGTLVLATVSGSWLDSIASRTILGKLFHGDFEALVQQEHLQAAGIVLLGELRENHGFPGLLLKVTFFGDKEVTEPVEMFIPWQYIETVIAHEKWTQKEFEKRIGFAVNKPDTVEKPVE